MLKHPQLPLDTPLLGSRYKPPMSLRHFSPFDFSVPFCCTSTYYHSFLPSSIRLWNSLPSSVKKLPINLLCSILFKLQTVIYLFICFLYLTSFSFLISISYLFMILKKEKKSLEGVRRPPPSTLDEMSQYSPFQLRRHWK